MHNNYYFLKQLSPVLEEKLKGLELLKCFSQNKDELILGFANKQQSFYIKAHLLSNFCCLFFPDEFHRSKKNSVDLFGAAIGGKVLAVRQFNNERSFAITLEDNFQLLFKMHGNRGNVILIENSNVVSLFKNNLANDKNIDFNRLDRDIDQSEQAYEQAGGEIKKLYPTFGMLVSSYLAEQLTSSTATWKVIIDLVQLLENPVYYIVHCNGIITFSLLPVGEIKHEYNSPIEAINQFYTHYQQVTQLNFEKKKYLSTLSKKITQSTNYINKTGKKLETIKTSTNYEVIANIVMANLHTIAPYAKEACLLNFYNNKQLTIKLNPKLSPQKNAENYYRKSKNQKIEIAKLNETLNEKKEVLDTLNAHLSAISGLDSVKQIRGYAAENRLDNKKTDKQVSRPYYAFHHNNFDIWVGKNAKNNDILTQKLAWKEDLWLHAKDVSGSHVIIKYQSGKPFPKDVIEVAAQLAAYYSKRKTDSLCPVIVTPKKFVRKRKGSPPGAVVVDKEKVILVQPKKLQ